MVRQEWFLSDHMDPYRFIKYVGVNHKIRAVLDFQCVDYVAEIYVNDNFVGRYEGFFAFFSFDVTDYIREENELVILSINDYTMSGTGPVLDGDKIYAATGPR